MSQGAAYLGVMNYVVYENHNAKTPAAVYDEPFDGLCELLSDSEVTSCDPCPGKSCAHKNGFCWSPVTLQGDRADDNVRSVTALVLDIDKATPDELVFVTERLAGLNYAIHNTHNHSDDVVFVRVVIELSRPVKPLEWSVFWKAALVKLALPKVDEKCGNLSRLYYLPTIPKSRADQKLFFRPEHRGAPIDVDEILTARAAPSPHTTSSTLPRPATADVFIHPQQDAQAFSLEELRECLSIARRGYSRDPQYQNKHRLLSSILEGTALAQDGHRDNDINEACSVLAFTLPSGVPAFVVVELMRQSIVAMPTEPEGLQHWLDKVQSSFSRASRRRADIEGERKALQQAVLARLSGKSPEIAPEAAPASESMEWLKELSFAKDGTLRGSFYNASLILKNATELRDAFRFNVLRKTIDTSKGVFKNAHVQFLHVELALWLAREFQMTIKPHELKELIALTSRANEFDPLADYLNGLQWDGVPRIADALYTHFGASRDADYNNHEFVKAVSKRWFISCVARGIKPGEFVKTVLILEGDQDIKKSSSFAALAGEFFSDTVIRIGDKDSSMHVARSWLIELAELGFLEDKRRIEPAKAYISQRDDSFRPPYAATVEDFQRRVILVATTNHRNDYLIDRTGNSRFWGVYVEKPDIEAIKRDRDQLWAEAVHYYKQGERWWLEPEEKVHAQEQAAMRLESNPFTSTLAEWKDPPTTFETAVTGDYIATNKLWFDVKDVRNADLRKIGAALTELGFQSRRKRLSRFTLRTVYWKEAVTDGDKQESSAQRTDSIPVSERDNEVRSE
jgi:predicted P-loop ATPase